MNFLILAFFALSASTLYHAIMMSFDGLHHKRLNLIMAISAAGFVLSFIFILVELRGLGTF